MPSLLSRNEFLALEVKTSAKPHIKVFWYYPVLMFLIFAKYIAWNYLQKQFFTKSWRNVPN